MLMAALYGHAGVLKILISAWDNLSRQPNTTNWLPYLKIQAQSEHANDAIQRSAEIFQSSGVIPRETLHPQETESTKSQAPTSRVQTIPPFLHTKDGEALSLSHVWIYKDLWFAFSSYRSGMANFLAQFQTIKNSCDHLVIAGLKSLWVSFYFSPSYLFNFLSDIELKLRFVVEFKFWVCNLLISIAKS